MKVLHIISGLGDGGAEGVLYRLCISDEDNCHVVVSLSGLGKYGPILIDNGVEVFDFDLKRHPVAALFSIYRLIQSVSPDVVQTWMYHADLIGGFLGRLAGVDNVCWNIRHSTLDQRGSKLSTIIVAKVCAYLSKRLPRIIVCCAKQAALVHQQFGYSSENMHVIPNGYNFIDFRINQRFSSRFRNNFAKDRDLVLLGMVGRFHPQKDHIGLLEAISVVKMQRSDFRFMLVGRGCSHDNLILMNEINRRNLGSHIVLLGQRTDINYVMNGLDIHVLSSSYGEGFPNVLAEAMACGTPCVATDVGDTASIIGDAGWIVPPDDPVGLAEAMLSAIHERVSDEDRWQDLCNACRLQVVDQFDIKRMIDAYHAVWQLGERGPR